MHFLCECGHRITDMTDYISYKAHLIPDQDLFDYLDEIDRVIENIGSRPRDKEDAMMKVRMLSIEYNKTIYQCQECGNIFLEDESQNLVMYKACEADVKKGLLQSVKGDKWQGFLYAEWVDDKPIWLENNGYISAPTLIKEQVYDNWETLEKEYYIAFNELKKRNVLRSSSLRKNKIAFHSWSLSNGDEK